MWASAHPVLPPLSKLMLPYASTGEAECAPDDPLFALVRKDASETVTASSALLAHWTSQVGKSVLFTTCLNELSLSLWPQEAPMATLVVQAKRTDAHSGVAAHVALRSSVEWKKRSLMSWLGRGYTPESAFSMLHVQLNTGPRPVWKAALAKQQSNTVNLKHNEGAGAGAGCLGLEPSTQREKTA